MFNILGILFLAAELNGQVQREPDQIQVIEVVQSEPLLIGTPNPCPGMCQAESRFVINKPLDGVGGQCYRRYVDQVYKAIDEYYRLINTCDKKDGENFAVCYDCTCAAAAWSLFVLQERDLFDQYRQCFENGRP